jgi:hypothetical protein
MNAVAKILHRSNGSTSEVSCEKTTVHSREIRYASRNRARKAGQWAIKKYSGVFKKLAA